MKKEKVWFVTGASQGLGLALVRKLLKEGYRVAATSRSEQSLREAVGMSDEERFLPLSVDLENTDSIEQGVQQAVKAFGRIDVLVNNAGYGMAGTVEEIREDQIRNIFEVNILAIIHVVKAVLPIMRKQKSGYIMNIGSVAGFAGASGWAVYSATKAAVAAFSEVLALDVKELGISVTVVEPSGFRTGFLAANSLSFTENKIEGYKTVKESQERYLEGNGLQAGDPEKAVDIFIMLSERESVPIHLFLGEDAYNRASKKLDDRVKELEEWKTVTLSADYA